MHNKPSSVHGCMARLYSSSYLHLMQSNQLFSSPFRDIYRNVSCKLQESPCVLNSTNLILMHLIPYFIAIHNNNIGRVVILHEMKNILIQQQPVKTYVTSVALISM